MRGLALQDTAFLGEILDPVVRNYRDVVLPSLPAGPLSDTAILALNSFVLGCRADAVWAKMLEVNCYPAAGSLSIAGTPLLLGPSGPRSGLYQWSNRNGNLVDGDVTINGVAGNGVNKAFLTGIRPNGTFPSADDAGVSVYVSTITAGAEYDMGGYGTSGVNPLFAMAVNNAGNFRGHAWDNVGVAPELLSAAPNLAGFYSISRVGALDFRSYFGNNANPLAQQAVSLLASNQTWFTDNNIDVMGIEFAGTLQLPTTRRQSFFAVHRGLTLAETQKLFSRVTTLRTSLGGGTA